MITEGVALWEEMKRITYWEVPGRFRTPSYEQYEEVGTNKLLCNPVVHYYVNYPHLLYAQLGIFALQKQKTSGRLHL